MALVIEVPAPFLDCKCDDIAAAKSSAILAAVEEIEDVDSWLLTNVSLGVELAMASSTPGAGGSDEGSGGCSLFPLPVSVIVTAALPVSELASDEAAAIMASADIVVAVASEDSVGV
jgi:hypothetical protein